MKKIFPIFFMLIAVSVSSVFSGQAEISPGNPERGSTIKIKYSWDKSMASTESVTAYLYIFTEEKTMPVLYEKQMNKENLAYLTEFKLPDNCVFGMIKFSQGTSVENNNNQYWDFLVYSPDKKPVKGANLRAAASWLGNNPANFNRRVNFGLALKYLEKEVELFPGNIISEMGLVSLKFDTRAIPRNEFEEKVKILLNKPYNLDDENTVIAVNRALRAINEKDKAKKIEEEYAAKHPDCKFAENLAYEKLAQAESFEKFISETLDFLKRFPYTSNNEKIYLGILDAFIQVNDYKNLKNLVDTLKNVPSAFYSNLALNVVNKRGLMPKVSDSVRYGEAIGLMQKALAAEEGSLGAKPSYISESEWKTVQNKNQAAVYEIFGNILLKSDKMPEALDKFNKSLDLYREDAPNSVYEKIVQVYVMQHEDSLAYIAAQDAIIKSKATDYTDTVFMNLYLKNNIKEEEYKNLRDSLDNIARKNRLEILKTKLLNQAISLPSLSTLDGFQIDLKAIGSKVIVLNFWSTWCGPCLETFSAVEKLSDEYKDNNEVVILSVNIWENSNQRKKDIKNLLKEEGLSLPIYIDKNDKLPVTIGLTGLPATVFIDKKGMIQFIETGFQGDEKFLTESKDRIDLLLQ